MFDNFKKTDKTFPSKKIIYKTKKGSPFHLFLAHCSRICLQMVQHCRERIARAGQPLRTKRRPSTPHPEAGGDSPRLMQYTCNPLSLSGFFLLPASGGVIGHHGGVEHQRLSQTSAVCGAVDKGQAGNGWCAFPLFPPSLPLFFLKFCLNAVFVVIFIYWLNLSFLTCLLSCQANENNRTSYFQQSCFNWISKQWMV